MFTAQLDISEFFSIKSASHDGVIVDAIVMLAIVDGNQHIAIRFYDALSTAGPLIGPAEGLREIQCFPRLPFIRSATAEAIQRHSKPKVWSTPCTTLSVAEPTGVGLGNAAASADEFNT